MLYCSAMRASKGPGQAGAEKKPSWQGVSHRDRGDFQLISLYNKQLRSVLNSYEPSRRMYRTSNALMLTGGSLLLAGAGSFVVLGIVGKNQNRPGIGSQSSAPGQGSLRLPSSEFGFVISGLIAVSLGAVSGIPLMAISKQKLYESARLYNSLFDENVPTGYRKDPDIRLGITPHGVGIVMSW